MQCRSSFGESPRDSMQLLYIFRLSKKTKTGKDNVYQSATRNIGRTVLQDKVS